MTLARETKVGLVVAASFLCLVGVVVAARLRNSQEPAQAQSTPAKITPTRLAQADGKANKSTTGPAERSKESEKKDEPPASPPKALPEAVTNQNAGPQRPLQSAPTSSGPAHDVLGIPIPPGYNLGESPLPPGSSSNTEQELRKQAELRQQQLTQLQPGGQPSNAPGPAVAPPPVPPAALPGVNPLWQVDPKVGATSPAAPGGPGLKPSAPLSPTNKPGGPAAEPPAPPPPMPPTPMSNGQGSNPSSLPPNLPPGGPPIAIGPLPHPGASPGPYNPSAVINAIGNPSVPGPIGPAANSPTIVPGPAAGVVPVVRDYEVKPYQCTPQDRSFAEVSRAVYGSEKYGKALWLFNRSYPPAGEHVRQDPPQLRPGQVVFFPETADVLQAHYPGDVDDPGPRASAVIPAPSPAPAPRPSTVPGLSTPLPLNPAPGNPSAAAFPPPGTPPSFSTADNVRLYRVREGGEHILQIAQTTLGDRNRWPEINRLNPSVDPRYPIPGGMEIRIPANPRVP